MHHRIIIAILLAAAFSACNKSTSPEYNDRPVVTGYLVAGQHPVIQIARQMSTSSAVATSAEDLNALEVYLTDDGDTHLLKLSDTVYTDTTFYVQAGHSYLLSFIYNGKEVTATTVVPSRPTDVAISDTTLGLDKIDATTFSSGPPSGGFTMPDPIDITWTNNDNSYYMLVAENTTADPELVRDTLSGSFRPAFKFRNQPAIESGTQLRSQSFEYFGRYRLILYHLQPEYATLYENSSNSSQNLTTPVTNVVNGFGIFTGMNTDTLFVNITKN